MHSLLCSTIFLVIASFSAAYDANLMLSLVNKERTQRGLSPLKLNPKLAAAAEVYSSDRAKNKLPQTHVGSDGSRVGDRVKRAGYGFSYCGENIHTNCKNEADCFTAWMNSQGHRENILKPDFKDFGSAMATDSDGSSYYTQVFGAPSTWGDDGQSPYPTPGPSPAPTPGPSPYPGPAPAPTPGPSPSPTPGPSPYPGPAPAPTPGPAPAPGPSPYPAPAPAPRPSPYPAPAPAPRPAPAPGPAPAPRRYYTPAPAPRRYYTRAPAPRRYYTRAPAPRRYYTRAPRRY